MEINIFMKYCILRNFVLLNFSRMRKYLQYVYDTMFTIISGANGVQRVPFKIIIIL